MENGEFALVVKFIIFETWEVLKRNTKLAKRIILPARRPESRSLHTVQLASWIPAFAGMTVWGAPG